MNKKLVQALILSLGFHGFLLGSFALIDHQKQVFSKDRGQAAIKVKLSVFQQPQKANVADFGKKKSAKDQKRVDKSETSLSQVQKTTGSNKILARYLSQVRLAITQNKYKSRIAQKMKLKGEVGLVFTLKSPNRIEDLKIERPSKYSQLNNSALQTVASIESVPPIPSELNLAEIPITVVISYQ